jgi:hypothetical protein
VFGPEHRIAREIIGVVVGQVQRGVEGLLHLGHPDREALAVNIRSNNVSSTPAPLT